MPGGAIWHFVTISLQAFIGSKARTRWAPRHRLGSFVVISRKKKEPSRLSEKRAVRGAFGKNGEILAESNFNKDALHKENIRLPYKSGGGNDCGRTFSASGAAHARNEGLMLFPQIGHRVADFGLTGKDIVAEPSSVKLRVALMNRFSALADPRTF